MAAGPFNRRKAKDKDTLDQIVEKLIDINPRVFKKVKVKKIPFHLQELLSSHMILSQYSLLILVTIESLI